MQWESVWPNKTKQSISAFCSVVKTTRQRGVSQAVKNPFVPTDTYSIENAKHLCSCFRTSTNNPFIFNILNVLNTTEWHLSHRDMSTNTFVTAQCHMLHDRGQKLTPEPQDRPGMSGWCTKCARWTQGDPWKTNMIIWWVLISHVSTMLV